MIKKPQIFLSLILALGSISLTGITNPKDVAEQKNHLVNRVIAYNNQIEQGHDSIHIQSSAIEKGQGVTEKDVEKELNRQIQSEENHLFERVGIKSREAIRRALEKNAL
jgi:hypothetical protein